MYTRNTIRHATTVSGVGLHSGRPAEVILQPAISTGEGLMVRFGDGAFQTVNSLNVLSTDRCTRIEFTDGSIVDTVEHLFAALAILNVTDVRLTFRSHEVPILDGSASEWVATLIDAGITQRLGDPNHLVVTRPFEFSIGRSLYQVSPGDLSFRVSIDFANSHIGHQEILISGAELSSLADSRTFVLESEIAALQTAGLALGGGLHNAVVVGENGPLNPEGYRHSDECVRHKALDLVGDLRLAGCTIVGAFNVHRPGHSANNAFLRSMLEAGVLSEETAAVQFQAA